MSKNESVPQEDAWIEKYRAAIHQTPASTSRNKKLIVAVKRALVYVVDSIAKTATRISGRERAMTPSGKSGMKAEVKSAQSAKRGAVAMQNVPGKPGKRKAG
jgi:hypothetical protein